MRYKRETIIGRWIDKRFTYVEGEVSDPSDIADLYILVICLEFLRTGDSNRYIEDQQNLNALDPDAKGVWCVDQGKKSGELIFKRFSDWDGPVGTRLDAPLHLMNNVTYQD